MSACLLLNAACSVGPAERGPVDAPAHTVGSDPRLPPPENKLVPIVQIAEATGWPEDAKPIAAPGLHVTRFASGLEHPRWLHVLPNGDVLVAETNAPERPEEYQGLKGKVMKKMMARAGAATPSANRITLLRDSDGDGEADLRSSFLEGLHSPFGMALVGSRLFVANTDGIVSFDYHEGATALSGRATWITELPAGPLNHHWTKSLIASRDGAKLYATVGSNSNIAENGLEKEEGRAAIWEIDLASGQKRLFASGLRNPNGMAWESTTGSLWTVVNERDELGKISCPITSRRFGTVDSTAGHTATSVRTWTHVSSRPGRISWPMPSSRIMRWARTWPRSDSPARTARRCPRFAKACSSGCTARGIASHRWDTRWCSCRSKAAGRRAHI
jgi:glucose/arabinose dehydrogenase